MAQDHRIDNAVRLVNDKPYGYPITKAIPDDIELEFKFAEGMGFIQKQGNKYTLTKRGLHLANNGYNHALLPSDTTNINIKGKNVITGDNSGTITQTTNKKTNDLLQNPLVYVALTVLAGLIIYYITSRS